MTRGVGLNSLILDKCFGSRSTIILDNKFKVGADIRVFIKSLSAMILRIFIREENLKSFL